MEVTIKELADELGVSKTAINKKIDANFKRQHFAKIGNKFVIDDSGQKAIRIMFEEVETQTKSATKTQTENQEDSDLVCVLKERLSHSDEQLKMKDDQIKALQKLLDQQQILTLQANQKIEQLEVETQSKEEKVEKETFKFEDSKTSFWSRIFK